MGKKVSFFAYTTTLNLANDIASSFKGGATAQRGKKGTCLRTRARSSNQTNF